MDTPSRYAIGAEVTCSDGACGQLRRVIIDPVARKLTHLIVEPEHRREPGRLVPVDLVDDEAVPGIRLRCTVSEFNALESAKETEFLPAMHDELDYPDGQSLWWPYYPLGIGGIGGGGAVAGMGGFVPLDAEGPQATTHDRVPAGEVQVRRGEHVHATDGDIGRVQGLVVDPRDHHVTHVLLDEGHLWGKKQVAIPIGAVTSVADGVRLNLTRDEVRALPPIEVGKHD
ncbi:PRC-barrel domain-containing protein [Streptomyces sp. H10-C2]|uniref:PRC-barrel domain-containing protein n=1 Tax=unclassified Streptomyces TaxID=2593676 RepID=UPI0024B8BEA1|nr:MULTISPECIES: PRC-barrel domain-containing protein [unclassified Streptomyces]MDJ0347313.1 PRC-barrel domain-containing protein [Streptomyces sp. PH10-H1]MDJ0375110.1 PRC-barrel domain-containing protein [Streptomyces sp. H10-C2]